MNLPLWHKKVCFIDGNMPLLFVNMWLLDIDESLNTQKVNAEESRCQDQSRLYSEYAVINQKQRGKSMGMET